MTERPVILVLMGCFAPGNGANGAYQSLVGVARALGERYRFRAIGLAGDKEAPGQWLSLDGIERLALSPRQPAGARGLVAALRDTPHDLVWTNGFFDRRLTVPMLLARRAGLVPRRPLIVSPHGEFSPGALSLKDRRKRAYLAFASRTGLLDQAFLHATGELEAEHIRGAIDSPRILVGPNLRRLEPLPAHHPRREGEPLRIVLLSRIDRKKNHEYAIERLVESGIDARFDIIGPVFDEDYWQQCQNLISTAPQRLAINALGPIAPAEVVERLASYDLFLFPTQGENYGYAIVDSLVAGTPLLLSDQTPWRGLEPRLAGVDLPLDRPDEWNEQLRRFAAMPADVLWKWRRGARLLAEELLDSADDIAALDQMLAAALAQTGAAG